MQRKGILLPFRLTPGDADIATATGDELRRVRIGTALSTRASSAGEVGELPWDPARGSALDALRNAAASEAVEDFAALYAEAALRDALPEEELIGTDVVVDDRSITVTTTTKLLLDASKNPRTIQVGALIQR